MARKRIYLVNDATGEYAWGNSEAMARALERAGYRRVSAEEYRKIRNASLFPHRTYREEAKSVQKLLL